MLNSEIIQQLIHHKVLDNNNNLSKKSYNILLQYPELIENILQNTSFIIGDDLKQSLRERIYVIKHNITSPKKCIICENIVKFRTTGKNPGYSDTCCYSCAMKNPSRIQKRKETSIIKYQTDFPQQSESVKQKTIQTNLDRYGRSHKNQSHISTTNYLLLTNKEWLTQQHYENKQTLTNISNELNVNVTTVQRNIQTVGLHTKHYYSSTGEQEIQQFLQSLNIPFEVNVRNIISPYELDIYIPQFNLAIEYCGLYWHSEQQGKNKNYHQQKLQLCQQQNIRLLTIFSDEWINKNELICQKLRILLNQDNRKAVYARKCKIVQVPIEQRSSFFDSNHIQGNGLGSISIGLEYNNELVACMLLSKQDQDYHLNRYATSNRVIGGFSKLLNYFKHNYEFDNIITFADLRWSIGDLYNQTGFIIDKIIPPDYYYSPDGHTRIHKFNYRRKYLPKLLKNFDPNLSEKQNCDINNVLRIWDCGKIRYTLTFKHKKVN